MDKTGIKIIATNRKAHFNYFLTDFTECGIALKGTEIKSLRVHSCSLGTETTAAIGHIGAAW